MNNNSFAYFQWYEFSDSPASIAASQRVRGSGTGQM